MQVIRVIGFLNGIFILIKPSKFTVLLEKRGISKKFNSSVTWIIMLEFSTNSITEIKINN